MRPIRSTPKRKVSAMSELFNKSGGFRIRTDPQKQLIRNLGHQVKAIEDQVGALYEGLYGEDAAPASSGDG
jgi:hypothetical protein